jgi:hypothetical protein
MYRLIHLRNITGNLFKFGYVNRPSPPPTPPPPPPPPPPPLLLICCGLFQLRISFETVNCLEKR